MLRHIDREDIPSSGDLVDAAALHAHVLGEPRFSVLAAGDIMLGGRAKRAIAEYGPDYPFDAVRPLLRHADVTFGNLEGPLASKAQREDRRFSYRVDPASAAALPRAGIRVVTLANNHLMDCGALGVLETLEALDKVGVAAIGAGRTLPEAHRPATFLASHLHVGVLGYYWNRRCAATETSPGGALDDTRSLEADIGALRRIVDRVVVTFHWGVPYEPLPMLDDRDKAHAAIDCGADAVIGHHPHVVQPFEVYRDKPIFYSVGNFAFGSGNSRGEGILVGLRFGRRNTRVAIYPLYVKNRDPRVNYQPKTLRGTAARHRLAALQRASAVDGERLTLDELRATMVLPYSERTAEGMPE